MVEQLSPGCGESERWRVCNADGRSRDEEQERQWMDVTTRNTLKI